MRFDVDGAARKAGVRDALIFVRESWGAEVMVRMWALGVSRGAAEALYRRTDTCLLDGTLLELEYAGIVGEVGLARLAKLLADSARVVPSGLSPDRSQMALPGSTYPPRCIERINADREGFTLFTPLLLAGRDGNVYVRDLRERNSRLGGPLRGREVYLLRPRGSDLGSRPEFILLSAGSIF